MPDYICECCNFNTPIKCKFEAHLETKKHLSNVNIMEQDKDEIIRKLREENMFLKGKVEAYEMMFKHEKEKKETKDEVNCDEYIEECSKSLELELTEPLLESIAELRTEDDNNERYVNLDNIYEAFVFNEKNNLPYIKQFADISNSEYVIADIIIDKVLQHCSIEITEVYKGRFKLYSNNKWLDVKESREKISSLMMTIFNHLKKYLQIMKHYYMYDSKLRQLDHTSSKLIQPILKKILRQLSEQTDEDELFKYILNKLQ
jgi:hypothetical protein